MRFHVIARHVNRFPQLIAQTMKAAASSAVKMANDVVVPVAKERLASFFGGSPESTGRLERSIHSATEGYDSANDYDAATNEDLAALNVQVDDLIQDRVMNERGEFVLIAGSWLPYACVVEAGRKIHYMTPAGDELASHADEVVAEAFAEAGLMGRVV